MVVNDCRAVAAIHDAWPVVVNKGLITFGAVVGVNHLDIDDIS